MTTMAHEKRARAAAFFVAVLVAPVAAVPQPAAADVTTKPAGGASARDSLFGDFSLRSRSEPISVRSDKLEFSYRQRVLEYTGQVVVTQGDLTLKADVLQVTINEDTNDRLQQITASGNVEIAQGKRSAAGGKAVFNQQDRTIILSDGAVLMEGPNKISGDRVIVYLDEERSVVEGGDRRVQALLYPGEDLGALGRGTESAPK
jgi:lipopolysaccharide export system protein LptA